MSIPILNGTAIAATAYGDWNYKVYFQDAQGGIREYTWGPWKPTPNPVFKAKLWTPLAAVSWDSGNQSDQGQVIGPLRPGVQSSALQYQRMKYQRFYYQSDDLFTREVYSDDNSTWMTGDFNVGSVSG